MPGPELTSTIPPPVSQTEREMSGLMKSIPRLGGGQAVGKRLAEIPGMVPSLREPIAGCAFADRCAHAIDRCRAEAPPLEASAPGHAVACWLADRLPPVVP